MKKILFVFIILLAACTVNKPTVTIPGNSNVIGGKLFTALYHQRAAEYKALCFQSYNIAREKLNAELARQHSKPLAIITDIDETVLDNSAYAVHRALENKDYETASWLDWTSRGIADTVPGALSFLQYAATKGVSVFYITNRDEKERTGTMKNLVRFNFPNTTDANLILKQTTSGKESRRQQVMQNYDVVLLLGDNLSDFSSLFDKQSYEKRNEAATQLFNQFGNRFIVLPNPNYGDWETALYKYNNNLTAQQKDSALKSWSKSY
jgi:5'-nucleotidase (lipoprotein e(P4) family)